MNTERIRALRKKKGMTQEELARKIGVKRAVISKYESGSIEPSLTQLQKIADALGVPLGTLLLEETRSAVIAGIPAIDLSVYLKLVPLELSWLAERLNTSLEVIQSVQDFGADYERELLAAVLYYGRQNLDELRGQKERQEEAYQRFFAIYNASTNEPQREDAWRNCEKYSRKVLELAQMIEDRERLDNQARRMVERYENRLENAVDSRLVAAFRALNEQGREEAVKRVQELAELKRYQK